ncbi:hypothetical protein D1872_196070 [compost metagenome]
MLTLWRLKQSFDLRGYRTSTQQALVTDLSSAFGIERSHIQHDLARLPFTNSVHQYIFIYNRHNFRLSYEVIISNKFTFNRQIGQSSALNLHAGAVLMCITGAFALFLHRFIKAFTVYFQALLVRIILCEIEWEPVRIIQFEGICSTNDIATFCLRLSTDIGQNCQSICQCFMEAFLFRFDHFDDEITLVHYLRVIHTHDIPNGFHQLKHKWTVHAQHFAIAHSPAQQTADHVTASFIRRQHTVTNCKSYGTNMVSNNLKSHITVHIFVIFHSCHRRCFLN